MGKYKISQGEEHLLSSLDVDGYVVVLVMFDLSAAFDIIDHVLLFVRLRDMFKNRGQGFAWFMSSGATTSQKTQGG